MKRKLDDRLLAVADCVEKGAFLADIGTDHAYLPIYLMEEGKIAGAVASDIHKGPLERADINIREAGLSDRIATKLTDGLRGIEEFPVTDVAIAGMGGLMIAGILDAAPFVKERGTRLILQPMQHIPELREYLGKNGYTVTREAGAIADGKIYQIICVVYTGVTEEYTEMELLLGKYNMAHKNENASFFRALCRRHLDVIGDKIRGMEKGGYDAAHEKALYASIEAEMNGVSDISV